MIIENEVLELVKGKNILLSISGGVDSTVLFDILNNNKLKYDFNIELFHLDHITRDGQSSKDAEFIYRLAESENVKLNSYKYSMNEYAMNNNLSEEEAGRELRYNLMNEIIYGKDNPEDWIICLGHNKNDQIETIIMRIIRGTGIEGLIGMQVLKNNIYRPLLNTTKLEILEYAKVNNIKFKQDYTNFENDYTRNSIRNELIPFIQDRYNPNLFDAINNLSNISKKYSDFIENRVNCNIKNLRIKKSIYYSEYDKNNLRKLTDFEIIMIIREEITRINRSNYNFESSHYDEIIKIIKSNKGVDFSLNGIIFYNSFNKFIISKLKDNELLDDVHVKFEDSIYEFNNFRIEILTEENSKIIPTGSDILIRKRKNGDKILFNNKLIKVKDFFINKKIDRYKRDFLPIIEYNGDIIKIANIYNRNIELKQGKLIKILNIEENK